MESDAKLWHYIYYNQYDQKPTKHLNESTSIETSTNADDTAVDQLLNDQLLLHKNNLQRNHNNLHTNYQSNYQSNHHSRSFNHKKPNYSKLHFDLESNLKHNHLLKRLFVKFSLKFRFYKFSYLTLLLVAFCLIAFVCVCNFKLTKTDSPSTSLPVFSSFKFNGSFNQRTERAEQLINDRLNSFERVLTVETDCASYIGTVEDNAFEFLGIQYAVPPVNSLRFRATKPIWHSKNLCKAKQIRKAKKFSSECFQINPFNKKFHGNEDCLYLNVWTPRLDSSVSYQF